MGEGRESRKGAKEKRKEGKYHMAESTLKAARRESGSGTQSIWEAKLCLWTGHCTLLGSSKWPEPCTEAGSPTWLPHPTFSTWKVRPTASGYGQRWKMPPADPCAAPPRTQYPEHRDDTKDQMEPGTCSRKVPLPGTLPRCPHPKALVLFLLLGSSGLCLWVQLFMGFPSIPKDELKPDPVLTKGQELVH